MTALTLTDLAGSARVTAHPTGATERIEGLISVLDRLADLLSQETQAVQGRDYIQVDALSERKNRLAQSYGERMRDLSEHSGDDDNVEPSLAIRMRESLKTFLGIVETNARALGAARTAHERFIKGVSDAVAEKARPVKGYSRTGGYGIATHQQRTDSVPIALNETA